MFSSKMDNKQVYKDVNEGRTSYGWCTSLSKTEFVCVCVTIPRPAPAPHKVFHCLVAVESPE